MYNYSNTVEIVFTKEEIDKQQEQHEEYLRLFRLILVNGQRTIDQVVFDVLENNNRNE